MRKYTENTELTIEAIKDPTIYIKPPKHIKLRKKRKPDGRKPVPRKIYKSIYE